MPGFVSKYKQNIKKMSEKEKQDEILKQKIHSLPLDIQYYIYVEFFQLECIILEFFSLEQSWESRKKQKNIRFFKMILNKKTILNRIIDLGNQILTKKEESYFSSNPKIISLYKSESSQKAVSFCMMFSHFYQKIIIEKEKSYDAVSNIFERLYMQLMIYLFH